jgi:hypothetical protein
MEMVPAILFDHDVEGHLRFLFSIWISSDWIELWEMLECPIHTFDTLGIPKNTPDIDVWKFCQARGFVLVTGNRNADGDDSLEIASKKLNRPDSLPVLTIADADRVLADRAYAERVASRILDCLLDLENLRGARRLFVP